MEEIVHIAARYYEESKNEAISEGSPELALELVFRLQKAFEDRYPDFTRYALYWRLSKALYDVEGAVPRSSKA
ncbi:hypothetical protein KTT_34290 [Tengunoibacter tsumagoiensis]|uniref:Uncharacterized protein n=1 Tax=Tengunoibacter tsumagoiensis TaxID=2014871 RepID=A0A402A344_9CHLR|nr:hypothetical protein KTT_34290 [Tengunoibacter tsumagoiensis]